MNTNSLTVYCAPPTNTFTLCETDMVFVTSVHPITVTNQALLAATYDMLCERIDVPSSNFVYAADKRDRAFEHIGTNRAAISASRALKYTPLVDWCGAVANFFSSGSTTRAGALTIHPMTVAKRFAGYSDEWIDIVDSASPFDPEADWTVLSPGRGNYGYQTMWGQGRVQPYAPSNSIVPVLSAALMNATHYTNAIPLFDDQSADASARIVENVWTLAGGSTRPPSQIMADGLPRVPNALVLAPPGYLISQFRYSWYHVNNVVFTNKLTAQTAHYILTAQQILDHLQGRAALPMENGRVKLTSQLLLDPAFPASAPVIDFFPADAPHVEVNNSLDYQNSVNLTIDCEGVVVRPHIDPAAIPEDEWWYLSTEWDADLPGWVDIYQHPGNSDIVITATNSVSVDGAIRTQVKLYSYEGYSCSFDGSLDWPTADAFRLGYCSPTNCSAYIYGSCSFFDDPEGAREGETTIYDVYGRASTRIEPHASITNLLYWYISQRNLPRQLRTSANPIPDLYCEITSGTPSGDFPFVVELRVPHGESPAYPYAQWSVDPSPYEGQTVNTSISVWLSFTQVGGTSASVNYTTPYVIGNVEWSFLQMGIR